MEREIIGKIRDMNGMRVSNARLKVKIENYLINGYETCQECPARKSGDEWQPGAKRRSRTSWFSKALPGRAGFFSVPGMLNSLRVKVPSST